MNPEGAAFKDHREQKAFHFHLSERGAAINRKLTGFRVARDEVTAAVSTFHLPLRLPLAHYSACACVRACVRVGLDNKLPAVTLRREKKKKKYAKVGGFGRFLQILSHSYEKRELQLSRFSRKATSATLVR